MRGRANLNIWLMMCCLSAGITGRADTTLAQEPVDFADANLKAAVERALNITNPTPTDMLALTSLNGDRSGIIELSGIEYATNLTSLSLRWNNIVDVSPLAGLINLTSLSLHSNQISDISALANEL